MKAIRVISIIILLVLISAPVFAQDDDSGEYGRDIIKTESGSEEFKANRIALIVGINEYLNIKGLKYATPDALAMKDVLEEQGAFTVQLMGDGASNKPTKYNLISVLNDIKSLSESVDTIKTFVFYFAGHGFTIDGKNYLAPMDVNPDDIQNTGINMSEVFDIVEVIQKNAKVMMFIDACRNDPISRGGGTAWGDENSRGTKVLYSTSEGDYSYELPELEHGVYTLHLTQALKGLADLRPFGNEDSHVSFEEAAKYVASKMLEFSTDNPYDISQTPRVEMMEVLGDFFITKVDQTEISLYNDITSVAEITEDSEYYNQEYYSLVEPIYAQLKEDLGSDSITEAIDSCNSILTIISQYEDDMDLTKDKEKINLLIDRLEKVINARKTIESGDAYLSDKDFVNAIKEFVGALTVVRENNLDQFISSQDLAEKVSRVRVARNIQEFIDDGDEALRNSEYDEAEKKYKTALTLLGTNDIEDLIPKRSVEIRVEKIEYVIQARDAVNEAEVAFENRDYREAYKKYDEAIAILYNNRVDEEIIPREPLEQKLEYLNTILEILDSIDEADGYFENGDYQKANELYKQIIERIKQNKLNDLISIGELENKINQTPLYKKLYINASGGGATSVSNFGMLVPSWNLGFTYRMNRQLSFGIGANIFLFEGFIKYSFINTTFIDEISAEFMVKANLSFNMSPLILDMGPYGIGAGLSIEYIMGFYGTFGVYASIRSDFILNFGLEAYPYNIPLSLAVGIVFNI